MPRTARSPAQSKLSLRGVTQNNLRGFDLELDPGRLHVVTGPSGSGKSSLAFDTLYAEGQRRYVETFSPYTRQFFERMDKPRVREADGILPAIAIQQVNQVKTSRSTVGTITEINDYLKLLMARQARAFCPSCGAAIQPENAGSILRQVEKSLPGKNLLVVFDIDAPAESEGIFEFLQSQGYLRVWWRGRVIRTDEPAPGPIPPRLTVIQDRVKAVRENRARLREAIENALRLGKGRVRFLADHGKLEQRYSTGWHCAECDLDIRPPSPGLFSFNHPLGACPTCRGFGRTIRIDIGKALPDPNLSLADGAVKAFQSPQYSECQRDLMRAAADEGIDVHAPFKRLSKADQEFVIEGDRARKDLDPEALHEAGLWYGVRGFFSWQESRTYKMHVRVFLSRYRTYDVCPDCDGGRFQPETLNFRLPVGKKPGLTLPELARLPVSAVAHLLQGFKIPTADDNTRLLVETLQARLGYLNQVGLGYLSLDRTTRTLSGGELQRVNLTTCLGAALVNTLFVLDEPSIGLHPRDTGRLIEVMHQLRDRGNTLVVVEHEEAVIRAADNLVDLGPGRGEGGGRLLHNGPLAALAKKKSSLTADYLFGRKRIAPPPKPRRPGKQWLTVGGATEHNLKNIDVRFPVGLFTCVTGVSGSGKSTLVHQVLYRNLRSGTSGSDDQGPGRCRSIRGADVFDDIVLVDQSPLARTPRSTPAVYVGIYDFIRERFSRLPECRAAGIGPGYFSFNSGHGRCERCAGNGFEKVEMQFLSDLFLRCPACEGRRFKSDILQIKLEGRSIFDILEMTVTEAIRFFEKLKDPRILGPLERLQETGLGYLKLGQPLTTLSGGESQRLKLVGHLESRRQQEDRRSLLIFDEPTTGLHFDDIARLLNVFQKLADQGHTLIVIEHNLDVIKCADHVIDLGPEAGEAGGRLVACGTPEQIAACPESHTGQHLKPVLKRRGAPLKIKSEREGPAKRGREFPEIHIHGAREHNLKNINLDIPRDRMVVVTGLSGSGKSSLAFDLLFAEGQRRFLDSMSPYARQFAEQMEKPDVDRVDGLPPTVAIEQRVTRGGGKSTVATITEVHQFLRLLFAKVGTQYCPECRIPVEKQNLETVYAVVEQALKRGRVRLFAPLVRGRKGFHTEVAQWARKQGFETLLIDGQLVPVDEFQPLERYREHHIDVLVGSITPKTKAKLPNTVERAIKIGKGTARLLDHRSKFTILSTEMACPSCGRAFDELDPRLFSFNSPHGWCQDCRGFGTVMNSYRGGNSGRFDSLVEEELEEERVQETADDGDLTVCPGCHGDRINEAARHVRIDDRVINDFTRLPAHEAEVLLDEIKFDPARQRIARDILPEIRQRLRFMSQVGLDYLTLDRAAKTLSGGESQRIRLSAQLGSSLRGVLYVLDEPTIGLHPRDNEQLLDILDQLKAKGNTLLIVEHDEDTMRRADHIIDLGPGAGLHGGQVVAQGTLARILKDKASITGGALRQTIQHPIRGRRRPLAEAPGWIELQGAHANNLRDLDIRIPLQRLTVISGVSGSGKSSLMRGVLHPAVRSGLRRGKKTSAPEKTWRSIHGTESVLGVYEVDQSPIGKTSRSTPATYIKVFDEIRKLYAQLPTARMRGYSASRFSFNTGDGRCEACAGQGVIKLEMNFLPASYIPCEECGGRRFNEPTREVLYNERSIADIMEMSIEEAAEFFKSQPRIQRPLQLLADTGLGYLRLGQPSPTLSGGEAQRLKLVTELSRAGGGARSPRPVDGTRLYLLEEPTIGLHRLDVLRLVEVLHRLVDEGQTVVVIEHQMDVIAEADYLIDIGPGAGAEGGRLVAAGEVEEFARNGPGHTADFLRRHLGRDR